MADRSFSDRWYDFEPKLIAALFLIGVMAAGYLAYYLSTAPSIEPPRVIRTPHPTASN